MFIVLEGLDGAGKSTQIRMLQELFARRGVACRYLHFPRFDAPVFGDLIARFLRGELGTVEAVDPYLVALLFAGDRGDAAAEIRQWLASGEAVVLDRYVYSNVAFQCAKLSSEDERRALKHRERRARERFSGIFPRQPRHRLSGTRIHGRKLPHGRARQAR